jgi:flavin-dependent thymidylate synthase
MPMRVILAGHNVDLDALKEYKKRNVLLTPESISAAYARISRSPKSIDTLRENARHEVAKARASNRNIIFEMGHHSVAEHAVFNFDILGISRRAIEEFERFRLCSYTEKSQRYVTLKGDYVVPVELKDKKLRREFIKTVHLQNRLYSQLFDKIKIYNFSKSPDQVKNDKDRRLLENLAKEDARYVLSLATQTQVGATINARNLELMIRRFASHQLAEMRELGKKLFDIVKRISPSIILFYQANNYDAKTYGDIGEHVREIDKLKIVRSVADVELVAHTRGGDEKVLAAMLFRTTGKEYSSCLCAVKQMSKRKKVELFKKACAHLELYDVMLREFEYADLTYALVVSAGCFGQLKRHRMASIVWSDYDPALGVTVPESVRAVGGGKSFDELMERVNELYYRIEKSLPGIGTYILTNAHRRRVFMKVNLRELYHISRLREDPTAQWDIRNISHKMSILAKRTMPVTTSLLGGKSDYPKLYKKLYGRYPKVRSVPVP